MNEGAILKANEKIIHEAVWTVAKNNHHLAVDELQGEAQFHALEAVRTYNPNKAVLSTWIFINVKNGLYDKTRNRRWQEILAKQARPLLDHEQPTRPSFSLKSLLSEVSQEAAEVINLALKHGTTRGVFRQMLYDLGWTRFQIEKVFQEVHDALKG